MANYVWEDTPKQPAFVWEDEVPKVAAAPEKAEATYGEALKGGVAQAGKLVGRAAFLPVMAGATILDKIRGKDDFEYSGPVFEAYNEMGRQFDQEDPTRGKKMGIGTTIANVVPQLPLYMTPLGQASVLGGTVGTATDAVQEGATPSQALQLMGIDTVGTAAAIALPPAVGKTLKGRIATGAAANVAQEEAVHGAHQVLREDYGMKPLADRTMEQRIAAALPGAAFGAVSTPRDPKVREAAKTRTVPRTADSYVQTEINDLDTRLQSRQKEDKRLSGIQEKIENGIQAKERQIENLSKLVQSDPKVAKILESLRKQVAEDRTKVESISDNVRQIRAEGEALDARIKNLGGEGIKADEPVPTVDPTIARAQVEEDAFAKAEQVVQEPTPDVQTRLEGLDLEIANLERFLSTKQGTKDVRADVEAQLESMRQERGALAQPPEIPQEGTPFVEAAGEPTPTKTPFKRGEDRYEISDNFHAREAEYATYSPETLEKMWANKMAKIALAEDGEYRGILREEAAALENAYRVRTGGDMSASKISKGYGFEGRAILTIDENGRPRPAKELLAEAAQTAKSPWLKSILERMQRNPNFERISTLVDDARLLKSKAQAGYLNNSASALFKTNTNALDVAHEYMHGAANDILIRYEAKDPSLTLEQRNAAKRINEIYSSVKDKPQLKGWEYSLSDVREFVAHLTDREFVNHIAGVVPRTKWESFKERFYEVVGKYMGMSRPDIQSFKELITSSNYFIDTAAGLATPKTILDAVKLTVASYSKTVQYATTDTTLRDPLAVLQEKLDNDRTGNITVTKSALKRMPVAGVAELAQANQKSPVVRHTFTAVKRADELHEEGKRFIIDGEANDKRMKFGILRNLTDVASADSYDLARKGASDKDLLEALPVALEAHRNRVELTDYPAFQGLSPAGQQLVRGYMKAMQRGEDWTNKIYESLGLKKQPHRPGYVYHGREGDYAVDTYIKDADGNSVPTGVHYSYTDAERRAFMRLTIENNPEMEFGDMFSVKKSKENEAAEKERELAAMIEEASKVGGKVDPELLDNLRRDAINARFFGGHHLFQSSVEGYKGTRWYRTELENARDFFDGPFHYADELGRFARNEFLRRQTDLILNDPEVLKKNPHFDVDPEIIMAKEIADRTLDPKYENWGKGWIDDMTSSMVQLYNAKTGNEKLSRYPDKPVFDRINGVIATYFNFSTMMRRPAFAASQALSWTSQVPMYLSVTFGDGFGTASNLMVRGIIRSMDMRKGTEFDNLIMRARKGPTFKPTLVNDFTQVRITVGDAKLNEVMSTGAATITGKRLGEMADTYSRYMAFSILYEKAKDMGLKGDDLFHFVIDNTDNAMSLFHRDKKAPIISRTGIVGDLLAPVSNYVILQGNWTATAAKKLVQDKNLQPAIMILLCNMLAAGTVSAPLVAEWEILRYIVNPAFEMVGLDPLPSAARFLHSAIGSARDKITEVAGDTAGRIADATMRSGVITGVSQAIAEAFGSDRGWDLGAGLRYQALGKDLFNENKTLIDSFSAWVKTGKDVVQIMDVLTGKDTTEAGYRKAFEGPSIFLFSDFLNDEVFMPFLKNEKGRMMQPSGKGSTALYERTTSDRVAGWLGTRTTRGANEAAAKSYRKMDEVQQQKDVAKAMQGLLDVAVRQKAGQVPIGMDSAPKMAVNRIKYLAKKYPDMEPALNTVAQRYDQEVIKKSLPEIVRIIETAQPHTMKKQVEEYMAITGIPVEIKE